MTWKFGITWNSKIKRKLSTGCLRNQFAWEAQGTVGKDTYRRGTWDSGVSWGAALASSVPPTFSTRWRLSAQSSVEDFGFCLNNGGCSPIHLSSRRKTKKKECGWAGPAWLQFPTKQDWGPSTLLEGNFLIFVMFGTLSLCLLPQ